MARGRAGTPSPTGAGGDLEGGGRPCVLGSAPMSHAWCEMGAAP